MTIKRRDMFDLESAMAHWRRQMRNGGINRSCVLDELESHLRDDIRRRIQSGTETRSAFETSVEQLGPPRLLRPEFRKINYAKSMKRILFVILGIIGVLVGMAFVTPAVALYRHAGAMSNENLGLLLLGIFIVLAGVSSAVFGFKRRSA